MRKQMISIALVSGLGLGAAAVALPGIASAADSTTTTVAGGLADRVAGIKDALKGLVSNGTITQAQADKVASTLASNLPMGRGGHGPRGGLTPEAVAKVLGITVDELRAGHEAGKTLAQLAAAEGISKADLISKLVAAAKAQLAADVTAGRLTQAQADEKSATLTARITEMVDRVGPPHGDRGPRPAAPAPTATTSSSSSTA
jgi:hypothetical protein